MGLDAVNRAIESSGIPSFGWSTKDQYGSNIPKPIGTMVGGYIIDGDERPDTDLDTGEPKSWPDGRPKLVLYLDLQTELREAADDDGKRRVYLRNQANAAAREALRRSGTKKGFERGGYFAMRLVNREAPKKAGFSPTNVFECHYQPPAIGSGPEAAPPPPPAPAPATAPEWPTQAPPAAAAPQPQPAQAAWPPQAPPAGQEASAWPSSPGPSGPSQQSWPAPPEQPRSLV